MPCMEPYGASGAHESGAVEADVRRAHKTALVGALHRSPRAAPRDAPRDALFRLCVKTSSVTYSN